MAAHLGLGGGSACKSFDIRKQRSSEEKPRGVHSLQSRSLQVQSTAASNHDLTPRSAQPERRSAAYTPSLWKHDDIVASAKPTVTENGGGGAVHDHLCQRVEGLKEYVRLRLADEAAADPEALLQTVDALMCLGVDYHFRGEIKGVLGSVRRTSISTVLSKGSLLSTSTLFRLLRAHHYEISQDAFDAFRDEDGSFDSQLGDDPEALLGLYEATFLAFEGEETLNRAQAFAQEKLNSHLLRLRSRRNLPGNVETSTLEERIARALEDPMHWRHPRLQVRWFIAVQEKKNMSSATTSMDPKLLELAKLDFDIVQGVHRRELTQASTWWENLGLGRKLGFCRDRLVENYFCVVGAHFEPKFWYYRHSMTKIFCLMAAMDDLYDIFGTPDELQIFTDAVVRWDVNATEGLPECMKLCFLALFNTVNDMAYVHLSQTGLDVAPCLKRAWAELCRSWMAETRWFHSSQRVTFEEYMSNSWVSIGWPVVCVHGYFLLAPNATITDEALQHLQSHPDVIRSSSTLIRLCNDLSTSKAELERGDVLKSVQCYMLDENVSEEVAREHMGRLVKETWKRLNRGCYLSGAVLGEDFLGLAIDGARVLHFIYRHGDGYARPDKETKDSIMMLIFQPIAIKW